MLIWISLAYTCVHCLPSDPSLLLLGALYNMVGANGKPFLVQQQWSIETQSCVQQGRTPSASNTASPPPVSRPPTYPPPVALPPPANTPPASTPPSKGGTAACVGNGSCINIFQSENYVNYIGSVQGSPGRASICWTLQPSVTFSSMQIVWNEPKGNPNGVVMIPSSPLWPYFELLWQSSLILVLFL